MFLMPVSECNLVYGRLKELPIFKLINPFIIVHYSLSAGIQSDDVHGNTHGNAKEGSTVTEFKPREHSFKVECRTKTAMDTRAPRIIAQESSEKNDLLDSETDCSSIGDSKQITNYRLVGASACLNNPPSPLLCSLEVVIFDHLKRKLSISLEIGQGNVSD